MGKSKQKTVKVYKEPCDKRNFYTAINLTALSKAAKVLDGDAFKMWVYFSKNQHRYEFQLSSKHAEEAFSLSKRRYDNAVKELIEKGFLREVNLLCGPSIHTVKSYDAIINDVGIKLCFFFRR